MSELQSPSPDSDFKIDFGLMTAGGSGAVVVDVDVDVDVVVLLLLTIFVWFCNSLLSSVLSLNRTHLTRISDFVSIVSSDLVSPLAWLVMVAMSLGEVWRLSEWTVLRSDSRRRPSRSTRFTSNSSWVTIFFFRSELSRSRDKTEPFREISSINLHKPADKSWIVE